MPGFRIWKSKKKKWIRDVKTSIDVCTVCVQTRVLCNVNVVSVVGTSRFVCSTTILEFVFFYFVDWLLAQFNGTWFFVRSITHAAYYGIPYAMCVVGMSSICLIFHTNNFIFIWFISLSSFLLRLLHLSRRPYFHLLSLIWHFVRFSSIFEYLKNITQQYGSRWVLIQISTPLHVGEGTGLTSRIDYVSNMWLQHRIVFELGWMIRKIKFDDWNGLHTKYLLVGTR